MRYVLKNISGFIKDYAGIFALIVVCQLVCILLTLLSFGVYQNFRNESNIVLEGVAEEVPEKGYVDSLGLPVKVNKVPEKYRLSPDRYDGLYKELAEAVGDKFADMNFAAISPDAEFYDFTFLLEYDNGDFYFYENFKKNMERINNKDKTDGWIWGRSFTKSEYINGDRVCIAPVECCEELMNSLFDDDTVYHSDFPPPKYQAYKKGDKWYVNIEGAEYECIGFCRFGGVYYIPYKNIPESIVLLKFPIVNVKQRLTQEEYDRATGIYKKYFPDVDFEFAPMELIDNEQVYYYNTNMWLSVLIAVISAVNLALIMNYILTKRRKSLAIFRIAGCSAGKARRIYVAEIMLILNVLFAVCLVSWILWILPALGNIFPYIEGAFSPKIYIILYLIYMIISYAIMNIMIAGYIRRQPVDLLRAR